MPLHVVWHLAVWVFWPGITRESRLKPPGPNLIEGTLALSGPMKRHLPLLGLTRDR
jgi:hypothetical protein